MSYVIHHNISLVELPSFTYSNSSYQGQWKATPYEESQKKPLLDKHKRTICDVCNYYWKNRSDSNLFQKKIEIKQVDFQSAIDILKTALNKKQHRTQFSSHFEYNKQLLVVYNAFCQLSTDPSGPVIAKVTQILRSNGLTQPTSDLPIKKLFWQAKAIHTLYQFGGDIMLSQFHNSQMFSVDQENAKAIINFIQSAIEKQYAVFMVSCGKNDNDEQEELEDY
jgi:hypothetical protein